jgi:hypothetical protein
MPYETRRGKRERKGPKRLSDGQTYGEGKGWQKTDAKTVRWRRRQRQKGRRKRHLLVLLAASVGLARLLLALLCAELFAVSALRDEERGNAGGERNEIHQLRAPKRERSALRTVEHLVATLDAFRPTLDTLVLAATDNDSHRLTLVLGETLAHNLGDLAGLLPLGDVLVAAGESDEMSGREERGTNAELERDRLDDAVGLLKRLLEPRRRTSLLPRLGLGNLADWPSVESPLLGLEGFDSFLGDRDVGLVVLGLVVEEPRGKIVLGVEGVPAETVIDELVHRLLPVDELRGERDSLGGEETTV